MTRLIGAEYSQQSIEYCGVKMVPPVRKETPCPAVSSEIASALTRDLTEETQIIVCGYNEVAVRSLEMLNQVRRLEPSQPYTVTEDFIKKYCAGMLNHMGFISELPKIMPASIVSSFLTIDIWEVLNDANEEVRLEVPGQTAPLIDIAKFLEEKPTTVILHEAESGLAA